MKTSLQWLSEFLPGPPLAADACADALMRGGLPVESIEKHDPDTVLDVEVTSNRSDCLSHLGVARELSALLRRELKDAQTAPPESSAPAAKTTSVAIEAPELCPLYVARLIRNVRIGPSPQWMQRRLETIGVRAINNVVDVTNYVLFELGQPLHAFDFDRLEGRRIIVRRAKAGEKIVAIDGHERQLTPDMLVIADAGRAVAVAGVMGGLETEVSDRTVNVLLESARFDPLSVRRTSRALALKSDSSYRFERGIDPLLAERASLRAAQLILETAGGELLSGAASAGSVGYQQKILSLRLKQLKRVLGIDVPTEQAVDALRRLRLSPVLTDDRIEVTVPSYRLDLNIEVDLIEEVARVIGYDRIPVREEIAIRLSPPDPAARAMETIRAALVAAGFFESVTFSFASDLLAGDFVPSDDVHPIVPLLRADRSVRKADAHLRPSILPGLLESVRHNESVGVQRAHLFEIGSTFWNDAQGGPREVRRLGLVGGANLRELRGAIEAMLSRLDADRAVAVIPAPHAGFSPAASGRIEWGGQAIGHLGMIDQAVVAKLGLRQTPAAAELDFEPLIQGAQHVPQLKPLPTFPQVHRDLSLVVPEQTRYEEIQSLVQQLKLPWLEAIQYVTAYRGKPLDKGQKSVTLSIFFRSSKGTLTSEEVESAIARVVEAAKAKGWSWRE